MAVQNNPGIIIGALALVVMAMCQVVTLIGDGADYQAQIDKAYAVGYTDGDADGFTEGIHAVKVNDHALDCACDSCCDSGRYEYLNANGDNPFSSK